MKVPVKTPICECLCFQLGGIKGADVCVPAIHSISGLNFVATEFQRTKSPSVASLSLGGGTSNAVDNAVVRVRLTT